MKRILCIGAGFVGGPTMAVMADKCPEISFRVVDTNPERIAQWNSDDLPIFEPGLPEVISRVRGRNLFFECTSEESISEADLIFVSVNTPTKEYGKGAGMAADLQYLEKCARDILASAKGDTIVVEKSTVPVRTAEVISRILHANDDGRRFQVLSNPEFLAEGTAIKNLQEPDRVLIGHARTPEGEAAAAELQKLYSMWVPPEKILFSNVWSSELAKLTANAMLAQRVSSINAISALCEKTQADVGELSSALGMDDRIGSRFLEAGVGFGGSCFRKDILNLAYICGQYGLAEVADYWKSVVDINDYQIARFSRNIVEQLFNTVAGKKITLFGFAFKPGTNDTRDSPAIHVCTHLAEERAHLAITDPKALEHARDDLKGLNTRIDFEPDPYKAAEGAHAVVLLTHWPEFAELDYERIFAGMEKPAFFFDGRRQMPAQKLYEIGFNVFPLGQSQLTHY